MQLPISFCVIINSISEQKKIRHEKKTSRFPLRQKKKAILLILKNVIYLTKSQYNSNQGKKVRFTCQFTSQSTGNIPTE